MNPIAIVAVILAVMGLVALLEIAIPLHARGRWGRAHVGPNLMLTLLTFATNAGMNVALVLGLIWFQERDLGLLNAVVVPPLAGLALVLLVLDFSFYVAHVAMHKRPALWRFHAVHHSDPEVDVTTTIRQHPGEGVIRYAFLAVFALGLGAGPGAFAVYRVATALIGLLEHANLRLPLALDRVLVLVTSWPYMHKLHHSRVRAQTDSNYGNLFSFWDRLFGTFTPSRLGTRVSYGLDGFDEPDTQTTLGLLALPFRDATSAQAPRASALRAR